MELPDLAKVWSLISDKLSTWLEISIKHIPNMLVAVLLALLFMLLANIAARGCRSLLRRSLDSQQIADLLSAIVKVLVVGIGLFVALDFVGLQGTVTSLLAGAGIIGLALGFAFQDMTENLIAGIVMGIRKPFKIGDVIEAGEVFGTVWSINLRNTLVQTFSGQLEIVPNKILFRNVLTNYSYNGHRRIEIPVGISYADDPQHAAEVIVKAINQHDFVIRRDETAVYAKGFGESSVDLLVWFWIDYPGEPGFMQARHRGVATVKNALEEADILIPFPIRTLDFGAKGGEKLSDMLSLEKRAQAEALQKDAEEKSEASQ
ncbi:mechanosensitive ion channel family protein [Bowmanella dokdonensis]|uniref:Small-conductance mechanosensitive channel n=1 Tax=Bowmanella dokdonensis TaxID=751969 RepID=A0A939DLI6_9ALTE|nr:mechanosensitive ion channel family protein [Bowmanella dokdonensis]MBN7824958.1 mechanosensitive ion channel family protein [Bowmanella dokdonensis]